MNIILIFAHFLITPTLGAERLVATSGQCTTEVSPDRASIVFTVEKVEKTAKAAIEKATETYEKLRTELKKTQAKDLELSTDEYTVGEKIDYQRNKNVKLGFAARLGIKASTSNIADISEFIKVAANLGINETGQLVSYLSDAKERVEKKKCLEAATANAKDKATILAQSLGMKVGRPISINERGTSISAPREMMMTRFAAPQAASSDMAKGPTVDARKQTISQEVEVNFSME
jgi:uncharacterized protein YggE